ncbi:hypothetical protein ACFSQD_11865 [Flavihumibacter stibioxidans]|uniref:hypothetical protein n=1 Tax=Flavihumibacter stibioxidans TaxID=1834163 RepID=UPI00164F9B8C|nr:hypothetical protein [Flavihumibacter stibioxidans]
MLTRILASALVLAIFTVTGCTHRVIVVKHPPHHKRIHHPHGGLPPGHAKKVYGSKSARNHAPGHKKKHH